MAVLCVGLRENARINLNQQHGLDTLFLAGCLDRLSLLLWQNTKDGQKGVNKPILIVDQLIGKTTNNMIFNSGEEFEMAKKRIRGD